MSEDTKTQSFEDGGSETNQSDTDTAYERIAEAVFILLNIGLVTNAIEELRSIPWFNISVTTYKVGEMGLLIWSSIVGFSWIVSQLLTAAGIVSLVTQVFSLIGYFTIVLWVFSGLARLTARDMDWSNHSHGEPWGIIESFKMATISLFALFGAAILRLQILKVIPIAFGEDLSSIELFVILFVDISWISLLLIAIGGMGSLLIIQTEQKEA